MPNITSRDAAKRLARAIVSDILLYNEAKVVEGLKRDNLFDIMKGEIDEGRKLYSSRVSKEITENDNFFDLAIVDIIVKMKGNSVRTKIW